MSILITLVLYIAPIVPIIVTFTSAEFLNHLGDLTQFVTSFLLLSTFTYTKSQHTCVGSML